jgi:hypothetical protein
MLIGEPAEMKISEAFFSAISWSSFSMNMMQCASVSTLTPPSALGSLPQRGPRERES